MITAYPYSGPVFRPATHFGPDTLRVGSDVRLTPIKADPQANMFGAATTKLGVVVSVRARVYGIHVADPVTRQPELHVCLWGTDHHAAHWIIEIAQEDTP